MANRFHQLHLETLGEGPLGRLVRIQGPQRVAHQVYERVAGDRPAPVHLRDSLDRLDRLTHRALPRPRLVELEGKPGLSLGEIPGERLLDRLATAPLPLASQLAIGVALSGALRELHLAGLAHGQLDASSVLVRGESDITLLGAGYGAGPCRTRAEHRRREHTDLCDLGALLFRCATGVHTDTLDELAGDDPRELNPSLPEPWAWTLQRLVDPDERSRWPSPGVLHKQLRGLHSSYVPRRRWLPFWS